MTRKSPDHFTAAFAPEHCDTVGVPHGKKRAGEASFVLLVDEHPEQMLPLGGHIQKLGFVVEYATDGERALAIARQRAPLLIILDKVLPKIDGFEVCRALRRESATSDVPIIIASIDADETDRIVGLELGADDYIAKPFSDREMALRVKKLITHRLVIGASVLPCLRFDGLTIDVAQHTVHVGNQRADLTATEFRLLELFARRNDFVFRRSELLERVSKTQSNVDDRAIDTHVRRLRQKLGIAGRMLETVRGVGYRFRGPMPHARV